MGESQKRGGKKRISEKPVETEERLAFPFLSQSRNADFSLSLTWVSQLPCCPWCLCGWSQITDCTNGTFSPSARALCRPPSHSRSTPDKSKLLLLLAPRNQSSWLKHREILLGQARGQHNCQGDSPYPSLQVPTVRVAEPAPRAGS